MHKYVYLSLPILLLTACGGSSTESSTPQRETSNYLGYMKSAYSEWFGERANMTNVPQSYTEAQRATDAAINNAQPNNFSQTNVQIAGVDESDTLKYDGQHLLKLSQYFPNQNAKVSVFNKATLNGQEPENPNLHFTPDNNYDYSGLLTHDGYTSLVGSQYQWLYGRRAFLSDINDIACYQSCGENKTDIVVYTWPFSENGLPLEPDPVEVHIDGELISTRAIEHTLYVISRFSPRVPNLEVYSSDNQIIENNQEKINELTLADVAPSITINSNSTLLIQNDDCTILSQEEGDSLIPNVVFVTAIDMRNPEDWQSTCIVGDTTAAFVSANNVYLTRNLWRQNRIEISKINLSENGPNFVASGEVDGSSSYDSYYYGEVEGKLALVNTVYDTQEWWRTNNARHQLSVLEEVNGTLEVVAQIPNEQQPAPIGKPGELIYAVRFMGDRAYVVTFDKVDPLYVIDLSDTSAPTILGELEIPGFSSYIHPINENLLIGVGKNAVTESGTTWYQGLNIRLFDVTDPTAPIALSSLDYGLRGSHSEVLYDPHAFSFVYSEETNTFRFTLPMSLHGSVEEFDPNAPANTFYNWKESGLFQFEVNTGSAPELNEVSRITISEPSQYSYYSRGDRAVIDGEQVYYAYDDLIDVFNWGSNEVVRRFSLTPP